MADFSSYTAHVLAVMEYNKIVEALQNHINGRSDVDRAFLTDWFPGYPRITTTPCEKLYLGVSNKFDKDKLDYLGEWNYSSALREVLLSEGWVETNPGRFFVANL